MAPSTTDAARLWRDTRVAYGDDAAQALAAFARLRKSGDFRDAVRTQEIPHIPEHALAAAHGRSGEGSRGGNIVRHTASGHAVYGPSIGGRTRKTSMPVDVLHQAAARAKAKSEDRHRQMSDAEREFAEGPNTVRRPYRTLHEEVYGEPLGKARRVKPGAGQGAFDFTAAPAAAPAPAPAAVEEEAPAATLEGHLKAQRAHIVLAAHHKAMAALDGADDESKAQHQEARQFHVDAGDKHGEAAARAKQMGPGATTPYGGTAERQRAIERSALLHDVEASAHHREQVESAAKRDLAMDDHARRVYGHMATASAKADMAHRTAAKALYEAHDTARLEHASFLSNAAHKATAEERETARWAARQTLLRVPPKGAGWVPIPGSQHGGWHKHTGTHWLYWYPGDEEPHTTARAGDAKPEPAATPQPAVATSKPAETPWISRRSQGKGDNYTVGQIVALKKMRGGGGAEGNLFEVVKVHRKWKDDDTDEWMIGADVRPATGPKADKIDREKQAAKDKADAVASTVALIAQTGVTVPEQDARKLPDGDVFVVNAGVHGSGLESMRLTPDGRAVWFHGGHYDDYRATQRVSTDPAAVAALRSLLAMKKAMCGEAETLSKGGGTVKPPPGFELVPHGSHGGYRKRNSLTRDADRATDAGSTAMKSEGGRNGRIGAWVYSGTSDGPIAHGIESGAIVVGTLAPMTKGWPLQAPPARTQRLAAEFEQRHDDQAGHWGGGGLAQWWKDTYAGQEHVTVPLWLQQAGLPYGTPTPAVAQGSLTPADEALARIYQAADARCATGLRVAQAQRAGVKIVAG